MSSKVYGPQDAMPATPIAWRQAGGAPIRVVQAGGATHSGSPAQGVEHTLEAGLQTAHQEGRVEGEAAGMQRAMQHLDPVMAQLNALLLELASQRKRLRMEAEEDTVKLAIAIARRVLHRELSTDPEAILGLVNAAFGKLNAREVHRLRVSPSEAAVIHENRARLELPAGLEITSDASFPPGCAVFETSRGDLDASVLQADDDHVIDARPGGAAGGVRRSRGRRRGLLRDSFRVRQAGAGASGWISGRASAAHSARGDRGPASG
jgi:flagellar assembly protein FliH